VTITDSDAAELQNFFKDKDNEIELTGLKDGEKLTAKHLKAFKEITYTYEGRKITLSGPIFKRVDKNTFQVYAVHQVGDTILVKRVWELVKTSTGQVTLRTRTSDFYKNPQNPDVDFQSRYDTFPVKLIGYKWAK
jgi:hypothetical protein